MKYQQESHSNLFTKTTVPELECGQAFDDFLFLPFSIFQSKMEILIYLNIDHNKTSEIRIKIFYRLMSICFGPAGVGQAQALLKTPSNRARLNSRHPTLQILTQHINNILLIYLKWH